MSYLKANRYFYNRLKKWNVQLRNFSEKILVGLGNPLLDITATVDRDYLEKYDLKENDAILASEKHQPIYAELIEKYPVKYTAGGSVANALRVFAWMIQRPDTVSFFGCVGIDGYAEIMKREAHSNGVATQFEQTQKAPTGTCAALITGNNRSFVANLGAASLFNDAHLMMPENQRILNCAKFFYIEGFFLAVSLPSIMIMAQKAIANNGVLVFNLSALYLTTSFHKHLLQILCELGKKIIALEKVNKKRSRIIVITNDLEPLVVIQADCVKTYPVQSVENIIDTTGAGDAFVGGFLSHYVQRQPIDTCVRAGLYASKHVLQRIGCTLEGKSSFNEKQEGCMS